MPTNRIPALRQGAKALYDRLPRKLLALFCIKYLYLLTTYLILKDLWYQGTGSYRIDLNLWKEVAAGGAFFLLARCYLSLSFGSSFCAGLMHILFVLYVIPMNCAFSLNNASVSFFLLSTVYMLLTMLALSRISRLLQTSGQESRDLLACPALRILGLAVCLFLIVHKLCYNGLSFSLSIDSDFVYESRRAYQEYLNSLSGTPFAYLLTVVQNLAVPAVPVFLLASLLHRRWAELAAGLFATVCRYSLSCEKFTLFVLLFVVGVYLLVRWKLIRHFCGLFTLGMLLLPVFCLLEYLLRGESAVYMLFIRREMYLSAWLNTLYHDFFSENCKVLWTQNVFLLQNLLPSDHESSPLQLISNAYFQGLVPSPNTGLFAESYMHFGFWGVLLYPGLLGLLFGFSGKVLADYGDAAQLLVALLAGTYMINVPVTRTDFVLSFFLYVFLLFLFRRYARGGRKGGCP